MKNTKVVTDQDSRNSLKKGVNTLAEAVKCTLGPRGRNVVIEREHLAPYITKDGVTVAKSIHLEDPIEKMGADVVKEAAQQTNDNAGDGTTTSTVIAEAIINHGYKYLTSGMNPIEIKRGIDIATREVVKELKNMAIQVSSNDELKNIALISANNDPSVGNVIAEAFNEVGAEGVITVMEGNGTDTVLDVVEGLEIDRGYLSHFFMNQPEKLQAVLEDCYILLHDKKIYQIKDLIPVLEKVQMTSKPLLIIAENVDGEALSTLIINKARGILNVCAIKAPGFGNQILEYFEDLSAVTNATIISEKLGHKLSDVTLDQLGTCQRVIVGKDSTVFVGGAGTDEQIKKRIEEIKTQVEKTDSSWEREKLEARLGRLSGGVAVIKVGAESEVEMKEKKDRFDDALHAVKAAHEEGIVAGGGTALALASNTVKLTFNQSVTHEQQIGIDILLDACKSPLKTIMLNAGLNGDVILSKVLEMKTGFNVITEAYCDMVNEGIIDPVKVTRTALEKASSVASTLLTTQAVVSLIPEEEKEQPMMM